MATEDFTKRRPQIINHPSHFFETLPGLYTSTLLYLGVLTNIYVYTKHRTPLPLFKDLLLYNSRIYALSCLTYLVILTCTHTFPTTSNPATLRQGDYSWLGEDS
ncbi:hypothetical protein BDV96DRAFT_572619 [Lophiotrema nucula]|uniref:Uncharacterized protein n=1 Tax=Lophiotrema nucula TaxID=690887 RepID=A0A6A5ZCL0_9PLEO|nr:hypothetical protein BDV96DRAFT_572619 [Lophiotrema nucula]